MMEAEGCPGGGDIHVTEHNGDRHGLGETNPWLRGEIKYYMLRWKYINSGMNGRDYGERERKRDGMSVREK